MEKPRRDWAVALALGANARADVGALARADVDEAVEALDLDVSRRLDSFFNRSWDDSLATCLEGAGRTSRATENARSPPVDAEAADRDPDFEGDNGAQLPITPLERTVCCFPGAVDDGATPPGRVDGEEDFFVD